MVPDGTSVAADDVVIRFDPTEMQQALEQGRTSSAQADGRIAKERVLAEAAKDKRDREAAMAEAEMSAARAFASRDESVFSRFEIIESGIDLELAGARMSHAQAVEGIERALSAGKVEVLRVQERQAATEVERAETALAHQELAAPHAGLLMRGRDWRGRAIAVGDTVWPGQKLAEVPHLERMQAEVFVLEADGGNLAEGMAATVEVESQPGVTYAAEVERVDTIAQPRVAEVPVQYFAVVLALDETDPAVMKIGQRVKATIVLDQADALAVPRQAVFRDGGDSIVYRRGASGFEPVPVTLGAATAGRVVISEGLTEGDEIALREPGVQTGDAGEAHADR